MKPIFGKLKETGFSLVELMIVVGLIGILATLAIPRFKQFQAKAKMGEAKNNLSHIYALQKSFSLENNTFLSFALYGAEATGTNQCTQDAGAQALGFRIDPCVALGPTPRYGYSASGAANPTTIASVFVALAFSGDGDGNKVCQGNRPHFFTINQDKVDNFQDVNVGAVCEPITGAFRL